MERPIKGGYILISLGLITLSTSYDGSIDYDRISRTKKHIVLTGIKVGSEVKPDITVKPIYGSGTITFEDVYGFDVVVKSDNSVEVSEHESEEVPNVEEAPSGTIVDALGLDSDGKVVKGTVPSGGTKLYKHQINTSSLVGNLIIISTNSEPATALSYKNYVPTAIRSYIAGPDNYPFLLTINLLDNAIALSESGEVSTIAMGTFTSDTVTEL